MIKYDPLIWHEPCNILRSNSSNSKEAAKMKIAVAYDGTMAAKDAVLCGLEKARETGGELLTLFVFNSGMFVDYDSSVGAEARAKQEFAGLVEQARTLLREKGNGVRTSLYTTEGNPEDEVVAFAREKKVQLLLCPPKFRRVLGRYEQARLVDDCSCGLTSGRMTTFEPNAI
jgi:nucleotide-binding universal stress UspA family protein